MYLARLEHTYDSCIAASCPVSCTAARVARVTSPQACLSDTACAPHAGSLGTDVGSGGSTANPAKRRRVRHQHFWRNSDKLPPEHRLYVTSADTKLALEQVFRAALPRRFSEPGLPPPGRQCIRRWGDLDHAMAALSLTSGFIPAHTVPCRKVPQLCMLEVPSHLGQTMLDNGLEGLRQSRGEKARF